MTSGVVHRRMPKTGADANLMKAQLGALDSLIALAVRGGASDLLIKVGQLPMFRVGGEVYPLKDGPKADRDLVETMAGALLSGDSLERFLNLHDVDISYASPKGVRARINIFRQRGELGMVIRIISPEIPSLEGLGLGPVFKEICDYRRGLVLVTGATGSGKSTTLAALIDFINKTRTAHIITIEDPVEFIHADKRSMVNQRELGLDSKSFADALRSALRQAPDVILVGELRDSETMEVALQAAETGHLVFSTMHTNDAADAMSRLLSALGPSRESVTRTQLGENIRAIISQRLVRRADKKGRVAAQEILINTATIREKILKGAHPSIVRDFISQGGTYGMQTFDQHLYYLFSNGFIDFEEGYQNATNRDDFALKCRGVSSGT